VVRSTVEEQETVEKDKIPKLPLKKFSGLFL